MNIKVISGVDPSGSTKLNSSVEHFVLTAKAKT